MCIRDSSDSEDGEYTDTVPTDAGTWYVKAAVTSSKNYTGLEAVKAFEIKEALPGGSSGDGDNDSGSGSAPTGDEDVYKRQIVYAAAVEPLTLPLRLLP